MGDGAIRLGEFLRTNSVSQRAAGLALGVSGPTIHDWITGAKRPRTSHREAIAIWTRDAVSADAWLSEEERAATLAVRPFERPDDSGEHPAVPASDDDAA